MILVDTSVWVSHFRRGEVGLQEKLLNGEILCHPFIIGELACGNLKRRKEILGWLHALEQTPVAEHAEILHFIETHKLMGKGLGLIDVHLLAATKLSKSFIWTFDESLARAARTLKIFFCE